MQIKYRLSGYCQNIADAGKKDSRIMIFGCSKGRKECLAHGEHHFINVANPFIGTYTFYLIN